jgi:hypothetical protein
VLLKRNATDAYSFLLSIRGLRFVKTATPGSLLALETDANTGSAAPAKAAAANADAYAGTRGVITGAVSILRDCTVATIVRLGGSTARQPDQ